MKEILEVQFQDHVANPGPDSEQNRTKSNFKSGPDLVIFMQDGDIHLVGKKRTISVPAGYRRWCVWAPEKPVMPKKQQKKDVRA